MIAIITGDIIGSRQMPTETWMTALQSQLDQFGSTPQDWEIYRGDEFQLELADPEEALIKALQLKARIKSFKNLDVRMGIGIGGKDFRGTRLTQSNGTAFSNSGQQFDLLKKQKINLAFCTPDSAFDDEINLMLKLALVTLDNWSVVSAQLAQITLSNPDLLQEEIGQKLGVRQAAISQRSQRARLDLIMELENYYRVRVKNTFKS